MAQEAEAGMRRSTQVCVGEGGGQGRGCAGRNSVHSGPRPFLVGAPGGPSPPSRSSRRGPRAPPRIAQTLHTCHAHSSRASPPHPRRRCTRFRARVLTVHTAALDTGSALVHRHGTAHALRLEREGLHVLTCRIRNKRGPCPGQCTLRRTRTTRRHRPGPAPPAKTPPKKTQAHTPLGTAARAHEQHSREGWRK
jgi:hypothetical protein